MSKITTQCNKCSEKVIMQTMEPFEGEECGVKIIIQSMPATACSQGHKRFIYPVFGAHLMDMLMDERTYAFAPSAVKKGLFTKRFHCPSCGKELPGSPTGRKVSELPVELVNADPFKVLIDVPMFNCIDCGKECIHSAIDTGKLAMKAAGHAFRGIDIHP